VRLALKVVIATDGDCGCNPAIHSSFKAGNTQVVSKISASLQSGDAYSSDTITQYMGSLTVYIAAVGTAWSLLGSPQNGQTTLYLFHKLTVMTVYS